MKTSGIYCLTSPSQKCYVGQARNVQKRMRVYKNLNCKGQRKLYNALIKHGFEDFKFEILEECGIDILDEQEKFWIQHKNSIKNGYNLREGGHFSRYSDESRLRISMAHKGKVLSQAHREKMSKARLGKSFTDETKRKMSISYHSRTKAEREATIRLRRDRNTNWGIQPEGKKFKVMFNEDGLTHYKGKFKTIEDAIIWRNQTTKL